MTHRIADYVEALQKEMRWLAESSPEPVLVHTIYFGGGTPSLLPAEQVGMILDCARKSFQVQPGAEISLEANPGTLSQDWLAQVHSMGANRLSLGMQSAHPTDLAMLQAFIPTPMCWMRLAWHAGQGLTTSAWISCMASPGSL